MNFSDEFQDSETLLRGVHKNSDFWNIKENRPTSAAFKRDPKGLSVNRTGEDKKYFEESLECLKTNLGERIQAIVEVSVDFCKSLDLYLKYCPINDNVYHSEIHKSETDPPLSQSIARELAKVCKIIA